MRDLRLQGAGGAFRSDRAGGAGGLHASIARTSVPRARAFHTHLTAVGANRQGAYQTGLAVARIRSVSHTFAGGMAVVAAFCILGVTGAGDPQMGQARTRGSVSAVVLGGAIPGLIINIIVFANIPCQFRDIVQGVVILSAQPAGIFVSRKPG